MNPEDWCRRLGYQFRQPDLLHGALTHRSASNTNYERLEFLGDAALSFVIADELYRRLPTASEGELTRLRAALVNRDSLAELARELELGSLLTLGRGELNSGGWRRASILADALEALIGAIYMDGGMDACRAFVCALYARRLAQPAVLDARKDAKTTLQEYLQARRLPLPEYLLVGCSGPDHAPQFTVECRVADLNLVSSAQGESRRRAEHEAAAEVLRRLQSV